MSRGLWGANFDTTWANIDEEDNLMLEDEDFWWMRIARTLFGKDFSLKLWALMQISSQPLGVLESTAFQLMRLQPAWWGGSIVATAPSEDTLENGIL